jgi:hypothetical protein
MSGDSQLFQYLSRKSLSDLGGVKLMQMQYQDFRKVEYINLIMRMGIDTTTTNELANAGFQLTRAYNLSLEDHHIMFEFMRLKCTDAKDV